MQQCGAPPYGRPPTQEPVFPQQQAPPAQPQVAQPLQPTLQPTPTHSPGFQQPGQQLPIQPREEARDPRRAERANPQPESQAQAEDRPTQEIQVLARTHSFSKSLLTLICLFFLTCASAHVTHTSPQPLHNTAHHLAFYPKRGTREVFPFSILPPPLAGANASHITESSLLLPPQSFKLGIKEEPERTLKLKFDREELLVTVLQYVDGTNVAPDKVMKKSR